MKKPNITYNKRYEDSGIGINKYVNGIGKRNPIIVLDDTEEHMANAIVFHDQLVDALIEMEDIWFNEVYEFAFSNSKGDHERALKFAEEDSHVKMMQQALKKAGCTE